MLGEEVLIHKDFRDMVAASLCYTVQAVEDCSFYVLDLTTFRQLSMFVGPESIAGAIEAKFQRRVDHMCKGPKVSKQLGKEARKLQKFEHQKQDRQQLRLPPSVGYVGMEELANVDDWLRVVFEHRKKPPDEKNPTTLECLEAVGLNPTSASGPGIDAMLRAFADPGSLKEYRTTQSLSQQRALGRRARAPNPMGEVVAPTAKYEEALPPGQGQSSEEQMLQLGDEASVEASTLAALTNEAALPVVPSTSSNSGAGIFFQTEPELDDDAFSPVAAVPPPTQAAPATTAPAPASPPPPAVPPRVPLAAASTVSKASSMPSLPKLQHAAIDSPSSSHMSLPQLAQKSPHPAAASTKAIAAREANGRLRHIMTAFRKAIPGKSILVFTDSKVVRKSVMEALLCPTEVNLCCVKSTIELWQRLNEAKEHHSALLLDLSKNELQVESLLRTVKQHERYAKLPIIVLSSSRDLPEVVRINCSFVVFLPLSAATLREALLWCFDRQTVQQHCHYDLSYAEHADRANRIDAESSTTSRPESQANAGPQTLRIKAVSLDKVVRTA